MLERNLRQQDHHRVLPTFPAFDRSMDCKAEMPGVTTGDAFEGLEDQLEVPHHRPAWHGNQHRRCRGLPHILFFVFLDAILAQLLR